MKIFVYIDARAAVRAGSPRLSGAGFVDCDLRSWTEEEREWLASNLDHRESRDDVAHVKATKSLSVAALTPDEVRASVARWLAREDREGREAREAEARAEARALQLSALSFKWLPRDLAQQRDDGFLSDAATREALSEVVFAPLRDEHYADARRVNARDLDHEDGCSGDEAWLDLETQTEGIELSYVAYQILLDLRGAADALRVRFGADEVGVQPRVVRFMCDRCRAEGAHEVANVRLVWSSGLSLSASFSLDWSGTSGTADREEVDRG